MLHVDPRSMGKSPHENGRPRERLSGYLREQYGHNAAKALARDISVTPKAAENLLDGHWPSDIILGAIVRRFGRDVLGAVFDAEIDPVLGWLGEEERRAERRLREVRTWRRQAEGHESPYLDLFDNG